MNQLGGFPLLTLIVFLPLLGGMGVLMVPSDHRDSAGWLAFLVATATLFVALFLYMGWEKDLSGGVQFVDGPWNWSALPLHYHLAVDGVNLYAVGVVVLLVPVALAIAWPQERGYALWSLLLESGLLGALTAFDLALFAAFLTMVALSAFMLTSRRGRMAVGMGVALALTVIAVIAVASGLTASYHTADLPGLLATSLPWTTQAWAFWTLAAAFALLAGIWPLHMPLVLGGTTTATDTQPEGELVAEMLIGCLLPLLGGYALVRFDLLPFPLAATGFAPAMVIIGTLGLLYGALTALGSDEQREALARWGIAQMGLIVVGTFSLQNLGLHGAVIGLSSLALARAVILMCGRRGGKASPGDRVALALSLLTAIGIPGTAGFVAQGTMVMGIVRWQWQISDSTTINRACDLGFYALIALGVLIGGGALMRQWRTDGTTGWHRPRRETLIALPMLALMLYAGVRPSAFTDQIGPSVYRLLNEVQRGLERDLLQFSPAPAEEGPPPGTPDGEPTTGMRRWHQDDRSHRCRHEPDNRAHGQLLLWHHLYSFPCHNLAHRPARVFHIGKQGQQPICTVWRSGNEQPSRRFRCI